MDLDLDALLKEGAADRQRLLRLQSDSLGSHTSSIRATLNCMHSKTNLGYTLPVLPRSVSSGGDASNGKKGLDFKPNTILYICILSDSRQDPRRRRRPLLRRPVQGPWTEMHPIHDHMNLHILQASEEKSVKRKLDQEFEEAEEVLRKGTKTAAAPKPQLRRASVKTSPLTAPTTSAETLEDLANM